MRIDRIASLFFRPLTPMPTLTIREMLRMAGPVGPGNVHYVVSDFSRPSPRPAPANPANIRKNAAQPTQKGG